MKCCRVNGFLSVSLAFSLAEILIVIGIFGFFAMLVISPFMGYDDQRAFVIKLRKTYEEFNGVLGQLALDRRCPNDLRCTGLFNASSSDKILGDEIVKYFRIAKNCETVSNLGCMSKNVSTKYDGTSVRQNFDTDSYKFVTTNGTSFSLLNYKNNCGAPTVTVNTSNSNAGCSNDNNGDANGNGGNKNNGVDKNGSGNGNNGQNNADKCGMNNQTIVTPGDPMQVCGALYMDVNGGMKGPNNFGRDIFAFWIINAKEPRLYPVGGKEDNVMGWWKNTSTEVPKYCYPGQSFGLWCTGRIIEDGWEMKY